MSVEGWKQLVLESPFVWRTKVLGWLNMDKGLSNPFALIVDISQWKNRHFDQSCTIIHTMVLGKVTFLSKYRPKLRWASCLWGGGVRGGYTFEIGGGEVVV